MESKELLEQAMQDISDYFKDTRGWIFNIGSFLVFAIVGPLVLFAIGVLDMNSGLPTATIGGLIAGAIGFSIWLLGVVAYYYYKAPFKLYHKIKPLAYKFTWDDISQEVDKESIPDALCLKVTNRKNFYIQNAIGVIVYLEKSGKIVLGYDTQGTKRLLAWHKKNGDTFHPKRLGIKGDQDNTRLLVIARCNSSEGSAYIQSANNENSAPTPDNIALEKGIAYKIRINWLGEVEGRKMDEHIKDYWITFNGQNVELRRINE
jgi:hypothetical protein